MTAYLGFGSNLGDRPAILDEVMRTLSQTPQVIITRRSSLYETQPVGFLDQPDFLNAVIEVKTTLTPRELLGLVLRLEENHGRVRNLRWGPRVIDIDILLYGEVALAEPDLTVPHPRLTERAFALVPLAEIAPNAHFPDGETVQKKLQRLHETGNNLCEQVVQVSGSWHAER